MFIAAAAQTQFQVDLWPHLNMGRRIAELGEIPQTDHLTYTLGDQPVLNQNWFAQLVFFRLYEFGGQEAVQFFTSLLYSLAIGSVTWLAWSRCQAAYPTAGVALLCVALCLSNVAMRPQAVSVVIFSLQLAVLWGCAARWPTWALACAVGALQIVWVNSHGAFPLGVVLPGLLVAGRALQILATQEKLHEPKLHEPKLHEPKPHNQKLQIFADPLVRRYSVCLAVAALASFVQPQPALTVTYLLGNIGRSTERGIDEWGPPTLGSFTGLTFLLSLGLTFLLMISARRRLTATTLVLSAAFAVLACRAERMVIWWALVSAPAAAPLLAAVWPERVSRTQTNSSQRQQPGAEEQPALERWLNTAFAGLIALVVFCSTPWTRQFNPLLQARYQVGESIGEPREAVTYLQETNVQGRVFAPMEWGAYLSWFLWPQVKVPIDARVDFFPDKVWNEYRQVALAKKGWNQVLRRDGVQHVVWRSDQLSPLFVALRQSSEWENVLNDGTSAVFRCLEEHSKGEPNKGGLATPKSKSPEE